MPLSILPYEIIIHVCSFIHVADLVNLATTCSYVHSCTSDLLQSHQRKLATLSTIYDTNRHGLPSRLYDLFLQDVDSEGAWYHREVVFRSYRSVNVVDNEFEFNHKNIADKQQIDLDDAAFKVGVAPRFWRKASPSRIVDPIEVLLILAPLRMPRLSTLRFSLHPSHGHLILQGVTPSHRYGTWYRPHAHAFRLFTMAVESIYDLAQVRGVDKQFWPPGLRSLQRVEVTVDELHNFNKLHFSKPAFPLLNQDELRPFFQLPNLERLVLHRHRQSKADAPVRTESYQERELRDWDFLDGKSSIQELVLVGFVGWQEVIEVMIRSVQHLRIFVLDQRGSEKKVDGIIRALQERHFSTLETVVLPTHASNALSWCRNFRRLTHVTVSYVEVMATYRSHASSSEQRVFSLADKLPDTIEVLTLIGGQQSSSVTSVRAIPLYSDIQDFMAIVMMFISTRGIGVGPRYSNIPSRSLRDICFGDLRIAVLPESKLVGKTLHQSSTKARELLRYKLNKEIENSQGLKEVCKRNAVRLHITNLKTKQCDHLEQHPYVSKKPSSRQELVEEAEKWAKDADGTVQAILSQYVDRIPARYRP